MLNVLRASRFKIMAARALLDKRDKPEDDIASYIQIDKTKQVSWTSYVTTYLTCDPWHQKLPDITCFSYRDSLFWILLNSISSRAYQLWSKLKQWEDLFELTRLGLCLRNANDKNITSEAKCLKGEMFSAQQLDGFWCDGSYNDCGK